MADEEHLRILGEGVDRWNQWRRKNPYIKPDLSGAQLTEIDREGVDFSGSNFSGASFTGAYLVRADFSGANLSKAVLTNCCLTSTTFHDATLVEAEIINSELLSADLTKANLEDASLRRSSLRKANLASANLIRGDLYRTDFTSAILSRANLSEAFLFQAILVGANLDHALVNGACIEGWTINYSTNLENVTCDHVFLKSGQTAYVYNERRPSNLDETFAPGDFTKLFKKAQETVDLIFSNGIDWKAFALSLEDLRVEYEEQELSIQAIENKNDGAFVIRLNVPPNLDKGSIERQAMEQYEAKRIELEAWYRSTLQLKDEQIADLRQHSKDLMELAKLRANQPIQNYINSTINQHGKGDNFGGDRIQGNKVIGDRDETSEQ